MLENSHRKFDGMSHTWQFCISEMSCQNVHNIIINHKTSLHVKK